jgi:hypothetical protein
MALYAGGSWADSPAHDLVTLPAYGPPGPDPSVAFLAVRPDELDRRLQERLDEREDLGEGESAVFVATHRTARPVIEGR